MENHDKMGLQAIYDAIVVEERRHHNIMVSIIAKLKLNLGRLGIELGG